MGTLDEFPVHTPTLHDERFYNELSDEFWLTERKPLGEGGWIVGDMNIESAGAITPDPPTIDPTTVNTAINITVDKYAHFPNILPELEVKEIFGEIEYFIMHRYNELERIFAYVRKIDKYEEDNYGLIYFNKFGGFQFIEVIGIDRCVGFFKIENLYYILDRERI
ncbi:hypothetical protein RclHR1_24650002 [Rhizophagus clarus]|uniref:Uncharacterized protein n=1 Tax=Rhizophagus clarus TaxID=94130 RepID=A0A2Z6QY99_9GLOM|nr:hypothetical protein RclHR1_24650002 [Rhizophagus clarus]